MSPPTRRNTVLAMLLLAAAALLIVPLVPLIGQEPSDHLQQPAPATPPTAVVVPVPPEATPAEATAIEDSAADKLEQVATDEVTVAEATRDPAAALDPGSGMTFWVLALLFGTVWRPIVGSLVDKLSWIDNGLKGPVSTGALAAFYVGAWALLHRSNPGLPQDWTSWVLAGLGGGGLGSAAAGVVRTAQETAARKTFELTSRGGGV